MFRRNRIRIALVAVAGVSCFGLSITFLFALCHGQFTWTSFSRKGWYGIDFSHTHVILGRYVSPFQEMPSVGPDLEKLKQAVEKSQGRLSHNRRIFWHMEAYRRCSGVLTIVLKSDNGWPEALDNVSGVAVPGWPFVLFGAIGSYCFLRLGMGTIRRCRKGLCPDCGYDLRSSAARCPECGHVTCDAKIQSN